MSADSTPWRGVSQGILVAGVGVFLLLTTLGMIPATFWLALLPYWPVLLVALGVRFIVDRSPMRALVLLSPLLILAAMTYVAMTGPEDRHNNEWAPISVARTADFSRLRIDGDMHVAKVKLEGRSSMDTTTLLEGRAAVDDSRAAEAKSYDRGDEARVRLGRQYDRSVHFVGLWGMQRDQWELAVPTDLSLTIDLDMALTSGEWDLGDVDVRRINLDGAFNDLDITLGTPKRDARLEFEGAFHRINLHVPANTRVYYGSDGFGNSLSGRSHRPRNDEPAYRIFVEGAFNRVKVHSP